jgi:hypothetical protein
VDPDEQESTLSREDIASTWSREGEWLVSPVLPAPEGANRVGVLIELVVEGEMPALEASLLSGPAPLAGWSALEETWSEANQHVAVVDFDATGDGAQLRMPAGVIDAVLTLHWSAVLPGDPTDVAGDDDTRSYPIRSELEGLGIVTREMWGASAPRCSSTDTKSKMAIHYTVTPSSDPETRVRAIQRYHQDTRGWCDIGYHFLIGIDGTIYEGRPLHLIGAHVAGHNTGNIGVSFIGCFHPSGCSSMGPTTPPEEMIEAGGRLLGTLSRLYSIPLTGDRVMGHRDFPGASTNCPGDNVYVRIDDMLAIGARSGLDSPPSEPPEIPPEEPPEEGVCEALACDACEGAGGCDWCASRAMCSDSTDACSWSGQVGGSSCWEALWPCAVASCWNPSESLTTCGTWTKDEDFSSGAYSVHRYWTTLPSGGPITLRLERTAGTFSPALIVADRTGHVIYGGEDASLYPDVAVSGAVDGRGAGAAEATLTPARDVDVYIYVTGWEILDAGFAGSLSTSTRYRLSAVQDCSGAPPESPPPGGTCDGLACDVCTSSEGCGWCASLGACADETDACAWSGAVGSTECWDALWPCAVASCWDPSASLNACGTWTMYEDFSSGAYSVHRYWTTIPAGGPVTLELERTAGSFSPALIVADRAGRVISGGEVASLHTGAVVADAASGRGSVAASVTIETDADLDVYVYVTGWEILDAAFAGRLPTDVTYRLSAVQDCSGGTSPPVTGGPYAGLTQDGSEIPRTGLYNPTLHSVVGLWYEPYGDVVAFEGESWVRGSVSWFGGPADTGVSSTETGAISGEVLRSLNDPLDPDPSTLASRPEDYYFVAMRWNYSPNGRTWWQGARLVVANPTTGTKVVVRPVDWGPNTSTGRIIDLSPQTLSDLGVVTDDDVLVAFASPGAALGVSP